MHEVLVVYGLWNLGAFDFKASSTVQFWAQVIINFYYASIAQEFYSAFLSL